MCVCIIYTRIYKIYGLCMYIYGLYICIVYIYVDL